MWIGRFKKLITFSDIFIGMGSMLLLEASLLEEIYTHIDPDERIELSGK